MPHRLREMNDRNRESKDRLADDRSGSRLCENARSDRCTVSPALLPTVRCATFAVIRRRKQEKDRGLGPDGLHQCRNPEDSHRSLQVVSQDVQTHLGSDTRQGLHQEMRRTHPRLERCERVLDSLSA